MILTPIQRKLLLRYRTFRDQPMSILRQVLLMIPMILVLASLTAFAYVAVSPALGLFMGGLGLGAILRQFGLTLQAKRVIPALIEVIDWEKVDRLLSEDHQVTD
jgi:hypothetical protein